MRRLFLYVFTALITVQISSFHIRETRQQSKLLQRFQARCPCVKIVIAAGQRKQCQCRNNGSREPSTLEADSPIATRTTPPVQQPNVVNSQLYNSYPETETDLPIPSTLSNRLIYAPVATINATEEGCLCIDPVTHGFEPCGCQCDCSLQLCSEPMTVSACPQDQFGRPVASRSYVTSDILSTTQPSSTLSPVSLPTTTTGLPVFISTSAATTPAQTATPYPIITRCVAYDGIQAASCVCLPRYEQCAENLCCLKAKYRTLKDPSTLTTPSAFDMVMSVLHELPPALTNIKNRLQQTNSN